MQSLYKIRYGSKLLLLRTGQKLVTIFPSRTPSFRQGHHLSGKDTILCRIMCSITKSLFLKRTLKYAEVVEDCTVTSDLRGKQKLHLAIQTLVTAKSLEGTVINYIHSYSPWRGDLFGGGPISINYSIRKLQYIIKKWAINHAKIHKNCLRHDISICILSFNSSISTGFIWIWRRFLVELNGLYSRFMAPSMREL